MSCPSLVLRTGAKMPQVGLGTWKAAKGVVAAAVEQALKAGYRHLDCACDYGNEAEVGEGIRKAVAAGVCSREDIFVTSKLWNTYHAKEHVRPACERTLKDLGLDYVDLYLIHFPISLKFVPFETRYPPEWVHDPSAASPRMELAGIPISETWAAMEELVEAGLAKAIGVSNFNCQSVMDLMKYAKIKPAVNQVELHPFLCQENLVRYCKSLDIVLTGYSPLGAGSYVVLGGATADESVLKVPAIAEIAAAHSKSPAQVVLRWAVQRGYTIVPASSSAERRVENFSVFDFELSKAEMETISGLDKGRRYNDPGVFCEAAFGCYYPIYA